MKWTHTLWFTIFLTITSQLQFTVKQDYTYDLKLAPKLFEEFVTHYKRNYTGEIKENKYIAFYDNLGRINAINQNLPGNWFAVIGPYTDMSYTEWVKAKNLTKKDYTNVGSGYRNVINCTDRRGYLFERFSDKVRDDYESRNDGSDEYYDSEEDGTLNGTEYDSGENQKRTRVERINIDLT